MGGSCVIKESFFYQILKAVYQGWNRDSNLGGSKFFVQRFLKIEISILEVDNKALFALIFYFEKKKSQMTIYNQEFCKSIGTS